MRKVFLFFFLSALCACETMNVAPIPTKPNLPESEQSSSFYVCQLKNDLVSLRLTGNGNGTRSWVAISYNFVNPDGSITPIPGLNEPCILDKPIFLILMAACWNLNACLAVQLTLIRQTKALGKFLLVERLSP